MRRTIRSIVLAVVAVAFLAPTPAAAAGVVTLAASLNGSNLAHATEAHPVHLTLGKPRRRVELRNLTAVPVPVGSVDLNGRVAGLTFFSFQTSVSFDVPAGQSKSLAYVLDTTGLKGQATGLVPSSLDVSEPSGQLIATEAFVSDINRSLISVYGLFGLGIRPHRAGAHRGPARTRARPIASQPLAARYPFYGAKPGDRGGTRLHAVGVGEMAPEQRPLAHHFGRLRGCGFWRWLPDTNSACPR